MGNNYLNEMCRLCLYKRDNLLDIFCINENHGYIAAEVIQDLLQIEVGPLDGFPRCVCSVCLDKLTDFKLFKKKCLESRSTFQQEFNAGDQQEAWRKLQDTQVEQDPLAFSRPIKVEPSDSEMIEDPVEVEIAVKDEVDEHTYNEEEIVRAGENQAASHGSTTESMAMTLSEKLTSSPSASMDRFCASTKLEQEVEDGSGNAVHFHSLDSATTLITTCFSIPSCVPVPVASISHPLGGRNAIGMDNSVVVKNSGESTTHHRHTIANNLLSRKSQECDLMEGKLGTQSNVMGMVNEISKGLDSSVTVNNSGESTTHHRPTIVNNLLSQKSQECDLMEGKLGTQSNVMGMVIEISQGLDSKGEQVPRKEVERRRKSRSGGLEEEKNNGSRKRRSCAAGGSTPRACTVCSKSFKTSGALRKHAQTHSGERCFLCSVCGKSFLWNCDLALHMRRHAGERPHSCVACSKSFAAVSDLNVHLRTHNGDRPYACGVCSKSFTRKGVLDDHMLTHTGERPYSCRLCSKAFRRRSHLTIHFRTHTGEKPYSCGICSKSFNESCSLKVHSRVHSKEKPYTCNVCYRSFSQSGSLNTHMRTHSAEKPYSCGACSKSFAKSDELSAHMCVHSKGRPHACGVCSESFSVINQLQLHMSEHEGETRYSCRMCFKSFPSCKSLNMHMLIHEPENVYKCDHCSHAYSDKSALRKHILKCHVQDKS
ncbi:zinc finger protein 879-like isoform X2 [Ischnura elegans]|uniref:zinc finger protein 879-like isoform X2 n=1 Tax=Ischnura elegans TaxID=197161 RepID=UPI001ED8771E|nr:zinc finger protein 879-like isoform X2 [Ischnura elegans]